MPRKGPADSPGYLRWRATPAWQRKITAALREHALTRAQFVELASAWWLANQEERPTERRVADHSGTDPMTTSQVLRAVERRAWWSGSRTRATPGRSGSP